MLVISQSMMLSRIRPQGYTELPQRSKEEESIRELKIGYINLVYS